MISLLFDILRFLVGTLPTVLFIGFIVNLADPGGRWGVTRVLNRVTTPFFDQVRGTLPRIGALDISPILIWLLSIVVGYLLSALQRNFYRLG